MAVLTDEMQDIITNSELFSLATASSTGVPNVVPVKFLRVVDETTIWITDNYFEKTLSNLQENPQVAFYIWSSDIKKSFQIQGTVEILQSGSDYENMKAMVREKKSTLPAKSLVVMNITDIFDCMPKK